MVALILLLGVWLIAVVTVSIPINIQEHRRLRRLADDRQGESICHFARSLDFRRLDPRIIRAVYEGLQGYLGTWFPVHASDDLDRTCRIDREDLDDLAVEIAARCGRTADDWERNPYFGRVSTVSDLIEFLCALPKAERP